MSADKQKLTVVVLTKNEEKIIARCLESVKWADEIIVIDDNSTDGTVEIARRYTDKIISHPLNNNFSEQRNLGGTRATGGWILQMDADERVTDALKKEMEAVLAGPSGPAAFTFGRMNNFCGKFLTAGGEDLHRPLRFFRKDKARFSGDKIHERLVVDGQIGSLAAAMEHYNFPDVSHYVATQDFYSGIEAKALYEKEGLIPAKRLRGELTLGPLKLFLKIYIKRKGFKDGLHGLIFAALSAWRRFMIYAKYWEMNKDKYESIGIRRA